MGYPIWAFNIFNIFDKHDKADLYDFIYDFKILTF